MLRNIMAIAALTVYLTQISVSAQEAHKMQNTKTASPCSGASLIFACRIPGKSIFVCKESIGYKNPMRLSLTTSLSSGSTEKEAVPPESVTYTVEDEGAKAGTAYLGLETATKSLKLRYKLSAFDGSRASLSLAAKNSSSKTESNCFGDFSINDYPLQLSAGVYK